MLVLYTDPAITKQPEFIKDIDPWIQVCGIPRNNFSEKVLSTIEKGTYLDKKSFLDRRGFKLPMEFLSTTSKGLLVIYNVISSKIWNASEIGLNAGNLLISIRDGNVYISTDSIRSFAWGGDIDMAIDVSINGRYFSDLRSFETYLLEEF